MFIQIISAAGVIVSIVVLLGGYLRSIAKDLRQDFSGLRQDFSSLCQDFSSLRQEVNQDINSLRQEVKQDINGLRQELKQDITNLDKRLSGEIAELRTQQAQTNYILMQYFAGQYQGPANPNLPTISQSA